MLSLELNPATLIVGIILLTLIGLAVFRIRKKGVCKCSSCSDSSRCTGCAALDSVSIEDAFRKKGV